MYQVLALDLDGTTLDDNHTIRPSVKAAIVKAQAAGAHVVIVTGRHHTAAKPYHRELGLTTPIICCNGTYVYDYHGDRVVEENSVSKAHAHQFLDVAHEAGVNAVMYVTSAMTHLAAKPIDYMQMLERWAAGYPKQSRPEIRRIASYQAEIDATEYVWKFVAEAEPSTLAKFKQHPFIAEHFVGEQSWQNRVDFSRKGNSKGARLKQYLAQLNISPLATMAIGDNHNDISMIELAGLGVAMRHSDPKVQLAANALCPTDNNDDGIAHLIEQYFLR